jgi:hypothetical protein
MCLILATIGTILRASLNALCACITSTNVEGRDKLVSDFQFSPANNSTLPDLFAAARFK